MRSPDASWVAQARWDALSTDNRCGFAHICPDFVAELLSPSGRLTDTMRKMEHWLDAGARLRLAHRAGQRVGVHLRAGPASAARRGLRPGAERRARAAGFRVRIAAVQEVKR